MPKCHAALFQNGEPNAALQPYEPLSLPLRSRIANFSQLQHGKFEPAQQPQRALWRMAAEAMRVRPLTIAVIGVSTTSGCGSEEPWDNSQQRRAASSATFTTEGHRCSLDRSWTRRMTDELSALLPEHTRTGACSSRDRPPPDSCSVHTHVAFRNAVTADYFSHCAASYLPQHADVILLEMATNDWGNRQGMSRLLRALRRHASHAPIAFVG